MLMKNFGGNIFLKELQFFLRAQSQDHDLYLLIYFTSLLMIALFFFPCVPLTEADPLCDTSLSSFEEILTADLLLKYSTVSKSLRGLLGICQSNTHLSDIYLMMEGFNFQGWMWNGRQEELFLLLLLLKNTISHLF